MESEPKPPTPSITETPETPATPATVTKPVNPGNPASQKMTVNVSRDLIGQAKDAFWLARGEYRTFSAWIEDALRRHIDATKTAHGVDNLPRRPGGEALPSGRPIG
jgi:hypothetical protein